ncbi:hypothetical protein [Noviherbaspirillum galbum]|uniref:Uncharacterized protein n=1 Tax=Noviherbaspirillum galbum TaxID=2709383 RepID=A0A6B3SX62_9BURK|nr:hypothetical protein [Noviherbaspirillum galbum]NEX64105.1 hypothetical protein [Noviherbaspirillum galbum]
MDIEFNDAGNVETNGTGWLVGFGPWLQDAATGPALRYMPQDACARSLCVKWMRHVKGDPLGSGKPVSEGRTISFLVSETGRFRLQFSPEPGFPEGQVVEHVLEKQGQFSAWGEGVYHRWFVDEDCTILTLRWIPG